MPIENHVITLNRVPEIKAVIDSGFDWVTIMSFSATALVVLFGAIYNGYVLKKTLGTQRDIALENLSEQRAQAQSESVAASRQEWINNLREAIAAFLAAGHDVYACEQARQSKYRPPVYTPEQIAASKTTIDKKHAALAAALGVARLYYARVQLHTNPNEEETSILIAEMNRYLAAAMEQQPIADIGNAVVSAGQAILKKEWVRVRDRV